MKAQKMKNTPSALKWMAEKRGRVSHELKQTEEIAKQVEAKLKSLRLDLAGLDRAIQIYDSAIDPEKIEPVAAWRGRYGSRGALREAVKRHLQERAPASVATISLEVLVSFDFGIVFPTAEARSRWYHNSLQSCLKKLVEDGLVERLHETVGPETEEGGWRWKQEGAKTLAELRGHSRN